MLGPEHTHNRFMALCPGLPGWAGTRRNIHPFKPLLLISHPYQLHPSTTNYSIIPAQSTWWYCHMILYDIVITEEETINICLIIAMYCLCRCRMILIELLISCMQPLPVSSVYRNSWIWFAPIEIPSWKSWSTLELDFIQAGFVMSIFYVFL